MKTAKMKSVLSIIVLISALVANPICSNAQTEEAFPKSKFYGDVFLNGNYNLEKNYASFRLNRLHFGYKHQFNANLYFNGMIEAALEDYEPIPVGGDYNDITNLFEFCLGFNYDKIEGKFGLIGTELNQQQEKLWKHRNIDKVFADKYGFAPTNDFGGIVIYKPTEKLKIDFALVNGEGHKSLQADSAFRIAGGITGEFLDAFSGRVYSDVLKIGDTIQTNLIVVLGYSTDMLSIGGEYNMQTNANGMDGYSRSGLSAYASYAFLDKYEAFTRYDIIQSNKPDGFAANWNLQNDGGLFIVGLQYQLLDEVSMAVNYRNWSPEESTMKMQSFIFIDLAINF